MGILDVLRISASKKRYRVHSQYSSRRVEIHQQCKKAQAPSICNARPGEYELSDMACVPARIL